MFQRTAILIVLGLVCLLPLRAPVAEGCGSVWGRDDRPVAIVDESAIIVWDAAQKVQHFIRWARFDSATRHFGFLVPTPTQPELKEVDESIFARLDQWTRPKVVDRYQWDFVPISMFCCFGFAGSAPDANSKSAPPAVRVLDQQTVGGFDTAVLEADDAEALRTWLEKHGYASRPELTGWLAPYLADKWKITAFKIAAHATGASVQTAPVRMSFRTDKPFFPYREPEESKDAKGPQRGARWLRVYFVGTQRVEGLLGGAKWSASVPWSNPLDHARQAELTKALDLEGQSCPAGARLTVFDDSSSPRPGNEDLWFQPAATQANIVPPDRVVSYKIWIPIDLVVLGMVVLGLVAWGARKMRAARRPAP